MCKNALKDHKREQDDENKCVYYKTISSRNKIKQIQIQSAFSLLLIMKMARGFCVLNQKNEKKKIRIFGQMI